MRCRRRRWWRTRPQTSTAVLKLNEMEGRSSGKAAKKERGGLSIWGGHAGKMIPAVNFFYIARKSRRSGEDAGSCVLGRFAPSWQKWLFFIRQHKWRNKQNTSKEPFGGKNFDGKNKNNSVNWHFTEGEREQKHLSEEVCCQICFKPKTDAASAEITAFRHGRTYPRQNKQRQKTYIYITFSSGF